MKFSIVVPIAPGRNAEVLESFKKLNYNKKNYEIIIFEGTNTSENRNNGAKKAKFDIIYFSDDDAYIDPEILNKAEEFFKKYPDVEVVGGPQLTPEEDGFFARMSGYVFSNWFASWNMRARYSQTRLDLDANENRLTSSNMFAKKSVFKKIDGFVSGLWPGEDPEFIKRAKENGIKVAYNPELVIYHRRRADFSGFFKQFFTYGYVRKTKDELNKSFDFLFFIPSLFVIYILLLPLWISISYLFWIPLVVYLIITAINSIWIARHNPLMLPFLPFMFFFVHFAYGLGRIWSFIKR